MIGFFTSYTAPIFLRITHGRNKLAPGSFTLGHWAALVGVIAVTWVSFIVVMLSFPPGQDPTAQEMSKSHIVLGTLRLFSNVIRDYSMVIVIGVFIFEVAS